MKKLSDGVVAGVVGLGRVTFTVGNVMAGHPVIGVLGVLLGMVGSWHVVVQVVVDA